MATSVTKFTAKACEQLGHYVYVYIDPRDNHPFYVGKGNKNRCFSHIRDTSVSKKCDVIRELRQLGLTPRIDILKYGLTEEEALLVESTAIDLLSLDTLTNKVGGIGSRIGSRGSVEEIAALLNAEPVTIKKGDKIILVNISQLYRHDMDLQSLYDATRSAWKVAPGRKKPDFAFSVFQGIVREVFEITAWVKGGTTMKARDTEGRAVPREGRWEFVGQVAPEKVRRRYRNKSVRHYYKPGAQNPIMYENC